MFAVSVRTSALFKTLRRINVLLDFLYCARVRFTLIEYF